MRHSESNDDTFDLKAKLEDLVDRTGRVEDMLDVLSGIYRKRSRHPEYADLRGQMRATADVLRGASESVASIFGEEDEEVLEHAAGRAERQEAQDEGKAFVLDGHKVFVHKEKAYYGPYSIARKATVYVVTGEDGKLLTDQHGTQREALAQAKRTLALRENFGFTGSRGRNRPPPSPQLQQARMDAMKALLAQQEGTTTANVGAYAVPLGPPTKNPFPNPAASGWESASVRALRALKAGDAEYLRALKAMGWLP